MFFNPSTSFKFIDNWLCISVIWNFSLNKWNKHIGQKGKIEAYSSMSKLLKSIVSCSDAILEPNDMCPLIF